MEKHIHTQDALFSFSFATVCTVLGRGQKVGRTLEYDESSDMIDGILSIYAYVPGINLREIEKNNHYSIQNTIPDSYLIMLETSSAWESLHKGLAMIRHASADSTYPSRLDRSHGVNYVGNALVFPFWVFLEFCNKIANKKEDTLGNEL